MRVDIYHHFEDREEVMRRLDVLEDKADLILQNMETAIMPTIDELNAKADETLAQITAETDIDNAIAKIVTDQNEAIKALKAQLEAAGTDQAKLDQLGQTMDAILATNTSNTKIVADAITANTPADAPPAG
jgi:hypothetical protein